jgi:hypothetical protein
MLEQLKRNNEFLVQQMLAPSPPKLPLRERLIGWLRVIAAISIAGVLLWFGHHFSHILFFLPPVIAFKAFEYCDIATVAWSPLRKWLSALGLLLLLSLVVWFEFFLAPILLDAMRNSGWAIIFASRLGLVAALFAALIPLWIVQYAYERITKPRWTSHPVFGWRIYEGVDDPKNHTHPVP